MTKITKFEFIECPLQGNSTSTRFYFPDNPQLRYTALNMIEIFNDVACSYSILSNNINITPAQMKTGFLVLYYSDRESVNRIPLNALVAISNKATSTMGEIIRTVYNGSNERTGCKCFCMRWCLLFLNL